MKNDFRVNLTKRSMDLVFFCNIDTVILDSRESILCGMYIKNRDLWHRHKFQKMRNCSMAQRTMASDYQSGCDVGRYVHDQK